MDKNNKTLNLVVKLGGINEVAKMVGITPNAIYFWIRSNKVPPENAALLYLECRRRNIDVHFEEIFHHIDHDLIKNFKN